MSKELKPCPFCGAEVKLEKKPRVDCCYSSVNIKIIGISSKELIKKMGYEGCRNCEHQIAPLRSCKWAEQGGDGVVHIICPMWNKRRETNESNISD